MWKTGEECRGVEKRLCEKCRRPIFKGMEGNQNGKVCRCSRKNRRNRRRGPNDKHVR